MADNSLLPVDGGTETFANDDVSGIKFPRIKVTFGEDGSAADASSANPLPVDIDAIGDVTDAKDVDPDTTDATLLSLLKGLMQLQVNATYSSGLKANSTALCTSPSTDGVWKVASAASGYQAVAASATATPLGAAGVAGDYIEDILAVVSTAATSAVTIIDGVTSIIVHPNNVGGGIGTYPIPIGMYSTTGGWKVTTGAGVAVVVKGRFTS